ncbi:MAG: DUF6191 domain-containing protein [Jatrophihabitantaceae bacterium]
MTQWGLDTLFNPGKRHMDEEKRRLQATREEIGDSSGGRRIDLESGKVKIRRAGATPGAEEAETDETVTDETVTDETDVADAAGAADSGTEPADQGAEQPE